MGLVSNSSEHQPSPPARALACFHRAARSNLHFRMGDES
jgi:hypothetical protein